MAEVFIGPLLSKLQEVAVKEAQALAAVSGEIHKLRDTLMWLQAMVHEIDLRSRHDGSRLVRVLACQTREIAFEAEDAIDLFYLQADLSRRFGRNWWRAAVEFVLNIRTHIYVRFTLSRCIQSLNARLQEIVDNSTKYSSSKDDSSGKRWRACRAIPPMRQGWDEPINVRCDEKKLKSKSTPEVIPVVVVWGIGERALLRHANDQPETFKDYFNVRIRMSSFPPGVDESSMVKQVEEALKKNRSLYKQQAMMQQGCYSLVVIESPVNTAMWSKLERRLLKMAEEACSKIPVPVTSSPDDVKGSSIKMKALVEGESQTLFNQVYGLNGRRGTRYQTEEMDKIRKNIMRITGGHQFAVVLVAKLMRTMDLSKWEAAAEYMMSSNEDSKLQTILSVCVDDLPDELKSCLLFTAGFPESRKIDAQQLVRLWMAEGFLTHHHGLETERLGQCYLKELIHRGLFQLVSKTSAHGDGDGCVERVAIHDQIHPLLRSEAQRTSFMDVHYGGCIPAPGNARRLALLNYNHNFYALSNGLGKLRTVVSYSDDHKGSSKREDQGQPSRKEPTLKMRKLLQGSPYLRVIDLEGIDVGSELPDCTGEMVLLQYLGVRSQKLEKLA